MTSSSPLRSRVGDLRSYALGAGALRLVVALVPVLGVTTGTVRWPHGDLGVLDDQGSRRGKAGGSPTARDGRRLPRHAARELSGTGPRGR